MRRSLLLFFVSFVLTLNSAPTFSAQVKLDALSMLAEEEQLLRRLAGSLVFEVFVDENSSSPSTLADRWLIVHDVDVTAIDGTLFTLYTTDDVGAEKVLDVEAMRAGGLSVYDLALDSVEFWQALESSDAGPVDPDGAEYDEEPPELQSHPYAQPKNGQSLAGFSADLATGRDLAPLAAPPPGYRQPAGTEALNPHSTDVAVGFESMRGGELPPTERPWLVGASPAGESGAKDQILDLSFNPAPMARTELSIADGNAATGCNTREDTENFLIGNGSDADAVKKMTDAELEAAVGRKAQSYKDAAAAAWNEIKAWAQQSARDYMVAEGADADEVAGMSNAELDRKAGTLQDNGGLTDDEMMDDIKDFLSKSGHSGFRLFFMSDKEMQDSAAAQQAIDGGVNPPQRRPQQKDTPPKDSELVGDYLYGHGGGPPPEWFRAQMAWIRSLEAGGWLRGYGGDIDPADPNADAGIGAAGAPCGSDGRFMGDPSGPDHPGIGSGHSDPQAGGEIDYEEAAPQTNGRYNEYNISASHDDGSAGIRLGTGSGTLSEENEALTRARFGGN